MSSLKKSIRVVNEKILDPIRVPSRKKVKDGKIKIKKQSLRGDSRFVQMAICDIAPGSQYSFPDKYACSEVDESGSDLTASIEEITGYGASDRNLVAYMKAKHHNIKDDAVKAYKDFQIIDAARSPENPIYLSYTPDDLTPIGGVSQAHEFAVYYAVCDKQAIGSISINKLKLKGE
jgi:CRISPR-associated endonuclease/helicase Cas3